MFLLKGKESFDRPNRASQSHGHALSDVRVILVDVSKFYPWYQIKPISQEFMSIKIDKNYPEWFVHAEDCLTEGEVPHVTPPVTPPTSTGISDADAGKAFVTVARWIASLF